MKLKLTRPLVFFDLETTGLNIASDRIVELSYYKVFPNGSSEGKTFRVKPVQMMLGQEVQLQSRRKRVLCMESMTRIWWIALRSRR